MPAYLRGLALWSSKQSRVCFFSCCTVLRPFKAHRLWRLKQIANTLTSMTENNLEAFVSYSGNDVMTAASLLTAGLEYWVQLLSCIQKWPALCGTFWQMTYLWITWHPMTAWFFLCSCIEAMSARKNICLCSHGLNGHFSTKVLLRSKWHIPQRSP